MFCFNEMFPRVVGIAALGAAAVLACGPYFGIEALQNRKEFLLAPPTISFEAELKALVAAPTDKLPVVESGNGRGETNRATVEARELSPAVLAGVTAMWKQSGGDAAYALGDGVPPAMRLYAAGAVSFLQGQAETAQRYFQNVLALPSEDRKSRELWAHYMLGRIAVRQENGKEAAAQFDSVRALVRQGTPDELGLAVASFGEQARVAWRHGEVANAVELYARQTAYGSQSGANSLVTIAGLILKDSDLLDKGIEDPVTRRLLFICVNGNNSPRFLTDFETSRGTDSTVDRIAAALDRYHLTRVEGAGLLALAAYSQGRFDIAQKFSALEDVPTSHWVMAKLALRRGDRETALRQYETALQTSQPATGDPTQTRMEFAVLRVSRGDYIQALDLFYRAAANEWNPTSQFNGFADYWGDASYLSERVLTIEELQDYVDHKVPLPPAPASEGKSESSRLRSVLARRLMRAGRRREALRYFDEQNAHGAAEQYGKAIDKASSWWRPRLARAEWWFRAAQLARHRGIDILAFEKEPDFAIWEGQFLKFDIPEKPKPADPYESGDERKRVHASKPERDVRFQYRLTAVDEAMKSADLLPAHSQAFAAVVCESARWVMDRQPERAGQIYLRYLKQGAYVRWGRDFGRACPQPDFAAASTWSIAGRQMNRLARHSRAHPVPAGLLVLSTVTGFVWLSYYVRAWRRRAAGLR